MEALDRGGGGVQMEKFSLAGQKTLSRATAGHIFSSRAKSTYLPLTSNLSWAIFLRPRAIHGPRAPIWEALVYK